MFDSIEQAENTITKLEKIVKHLQGEKYRGATSSKIKHMDVLNIAKNELERMKK